MLTALVAGFRKRLITVDISLPFSFLYFESQLESWRVPASTLLKCAKCQLPLCGFRSKISRRFKEKWICAPKPAAVVAFKPPWTGAMLMVINSYTCFLLWTGTTLQRVGGQRTNFPPKISLSEQSSTAHLPDGSPDKRPLFSKCLGLNISIEGGPVIFHWNSLRNLFCFQQSMWSVDFCQ